MILKIKSLAVPAVSLDTFIITCCIVFYRIVYNTLFDFMIRDVVNLLDQVLDVVEGVMLQPGLEDVPYLLNGVEVW